MLSFLLSHIWQQARSALGRRVLPALVQSASCIWETRTIMRWHMPAEQTPALHGACLAAIALEYLLVAYTRQGDLCGNGPILERFEWSCNASHRSATFLCSPFRGQVEAAWGVLVGAG